MTALASPPPGAGLLAATFGSADGVLLAAVILLFLASIVLALAETALTRVSRAKAKPCPRRRDAAGRCCCR